MSSASSASERRAVDHVALAGPTALGGQDVRLDGVVDVDDAQPGVHEHLQLAVEVGDQDPAGPARAARALDADDGLTATRSRPTARAAAKAATSPSCLERS